MAPLKLEFQAFGSCPMGFWEPSSSPQQRAASTPELKSHSFSPHKLYNFLKKNRITYKYKDIYYLNYIIYPSI